MIISMKMQDNLESKKEKKGRPKGSKSRLGIPPKGIIEALALVKGAYEQSKGNTMSVQDITEFMNLKKGSNYPILGMLATDYGLIEKEGEIGYKISDLGKRAIKGEKFAVKESFEKNPIFRDLSSQFWDKNVTPGLIVDYLKKKYKKGENVSTITQRFLEGVNYIKSLGTKQESYESESEVQIGSTDDLIKIINIIKLKYALNPPQKEELKSIVEGVCNELKNDRNEAIKALAHNMEKNKNNNEVLKALSESLLSVISAYNPKLNILNESPKERKKSEKRDDNEEGQE